MLQKCVERWCKLANKKVEQLYKVSSKHLFGCWSIRAGRTRIISRIIRSLLTNCLEMLVSGTNWTTSHLVFSRQGCEMSPRYDRRLARLISGTQHTNDFRQYCHVANTAQHCRLGLFQDSDFAGDLEDSKSTSGGVLCIFGRRTFVPISWMCENRNSVSHRCTEVLRSTSNSVRPNHNGIEEISARSNSNARITRIGEH